MSIVDKSTSKMPETIPEYDRIGQDIAKLLGLEKGDHGRYETTIGSKTDVGLAKTIHRIMIEKGFIK